MPDGTPCIICAVSAGYKLFYNHVDRFMYIMADLLQHRRYADEIMNILASEEMQRIKRAMAQAKPNDPSPCGSARKFRLCHGPKREGDPAEC